jgi:phenylalanyl-tRNA synthetase alpha chain
MINEIEKLLLLAENFTIQNKADLEQFRLVFLSKNGKTNELMDRFKLVAKEDKREIGQRINELKQALSNKFEQAQNQISQRIEDSENFDYDVFLDVISQGKGSKHPIKVVAEEIESIFDKCGFKVADGPEIEDDWHNFSALNFPPDHPARDMQDTFFIDLENALRTHTSSVQVRIMEAGSLPIRIISPGRVYRNEAVSARANCFFHQIEALYIDENVTFKDLKHILLHFAQEFFGVDTKIRLRASYFPFTEPSAEMDISCVLCQGNGCNVCKYTGWLEILGCGMVHPNVLESCNIDSAKYSGYALGMGIERLTMLRYGVKDLRLFFDNDVRFLKQFVAV